MQLPKIPDCLKKHKYKGGEDDIFLLIFSLI